MPTMLLSDAISNIPVEFDNAGGDAVDPPAGALSFTLDNSAMGSVATGADGKSCDFTPTQPADLTQVGTITGTDTAGSQFNMTLDIGLAADPAAVRGHFVPSEITTRPLTPP